MTNWTTKRLLQCLSLGFGFSFCILDGHTLYPVFWMVFGILDGVFETWYNQVTNWTDWECLSLALDFLVDQESWLPSAGPIDCSTCFLFSLLVYLYFLYLYLYFRVPVTCSDILANQPTERHLLDKLISQIYFLCCLILSEQSTKQRWPLLESDKGDKWRDKNELHIHVRDLQFVRTDWSLGRVKTSPQAKHHKLSFLFTSFTILTSLDLIQRVPTEVYYPPIDV